MAYAAPPGDTVEFWFDTGYFIPAGDALAFDFQDSILNASITGSGGVRVGGSAPEGTSYTFIEVGSGGVRIGGAAPNEVFIASVFDEVGSGGVTVGGVALEELFTPVFATIVGSGGITIGGFADEFFTGSMNYTATGGLVISGSAPNTVEYVWEELASGGIMIAGAAPNSITIPTIYTDVASGGTVVGGTAPNDATQASFSTWVGVGGITIGGAAPVTTLIDETGLGGGIKVGGAAPNVGIQVMDYNDTGSGGITIGGVALAFKMEPGIDARLPRPNAALSNSGWTNWINGRLPGVMGASITAMVGASVDARLTVLSSDFINLLGTAGEVVADLYPMYAVLNGGENMIDGVHGYIPAMQADLAGTPGSIGTVDAALPKLTSDVSGYTTTIGTIDAPLPMLQAAAVALNGVIGSIDVLLHRIRGDSVAVVGTSGLMACILPTLQARVAGYSQVDAAVTAKMTSLRGELVGDIMPMYVSTMMLNTINSALSEYERFEFSSFCEHKGSYYGTGTDGLVKVDVRDDDFDGTDYLPIDAVVSTGDLDFGSEMQKRIADFYIAMRAAGDLKLNIATDENDPVEYTLSPYAIDTLKQRRVITAKGARGKYWRFELSNTDGCDFEVDTMNVAVTQVTRRI